MTDNTIIIPWTTTQNDKKKDENDRPRTNVTGDNNKIECLFIMMST